MPLAQTATTVPVVVDNALCITNKGCTVCVDVCPLDVLRIVETDDGTKTAYMKYDECWYCMPCEANCPTNAVIVNLTYLLK
ncbi:ferredoxin family protein [Actibacterium sp. 188UL27-1]|uniref:4Fe-4S dicluster domain-containing protein n=1 Tax=Actibacterium sp. 188UL27-1 TaxID=2786961 RepID=UPI00195D2971|nr:ferredoxin family protein [Actibacterium sp. 188UL27-1]MBM7067186.1 ferredoxin family protein [Actibacterium sp. 188UL27-1]